MGNSEDILNRLAFEFPPLQQPVANYVPAVRTGSMLFLSGAGPAKGSDGKTLRGTLGLDFSVEEGYAAAQSVGLVQLSRLKHELGELDRVKSIVKLLGMVNSTSQFTDHASVINGCSDLLVKVFGNEGRHSRSAIGMTNLPFGIPVEIEMIVEIET